MVCEQSQLDISKMSLQCEPDFVFETHSAIFGVMSTEFLNHGICHQSMIDKIIKEESYSNCTSAMDETAVKKINK